ncbi:hypothetical protein PR202_gb14691 [Eleusine coracana subsp. coracana]|uniref:KIB1-4 beta-propeller domain-containing protein n=1 Tax=Eleusine coracana subsp. coracana TaxID=191504 RepID=A0AAV5EVW9_ELECO|nr:hypothetical protein PR202_gb14691 [Eleusine coracana subsp. coracana]
MMDHALFLGLNHSACLPIKSFPGLQPHCIYFSSPWMLETFDWIHKICRGLGGVRTYDLKTRRFERVFPLSERKEWISPYQVWITPNL